MKKITILSILFLICFIVNSQPEVKWQSILGGLSNEPSGIGDYSYVCIDRNENNELFITSNSRSNDSLVIGNHGSISCYVVKMDVNGDTIWSKMIGGTAYDVPRSIIALDDGGCIIGGWTNSNDFDLVNHHGSTDFLDAFVCRLDKNGDILWTKQYGGGLLGLLYPHDLFYKIIQLNDGNFMAVGHTRSTDGDLKSDYTKFRCGWAMKFDSTGKILISEKIATDNHDQYSTTHVYDILELKDGSGFVIIGTVDDRYDGGKIWLAKYNVSFTEKIWEHKYGCTSLNYNPSLAKAEYDNIVFVSNIYNNEGDVDGEFYGSGFDIWVVKTNSKGEIIKQNVYGSSGSEPAYDLNNDGKGNFIISGISSFQDYYAHGGDTNNRPDIWMIDFDYNLDTLWTYKFGGNNLDYIKETVPSEDGSFIYGSGWTNSTEGLVQGKYGGIDVWVGKISNPAIRNEFIICGDSVTLIRPVEYSGVGTLSYTWSPSTALSSINEKTPKAAPLVNTAYYVNITDGIGFTVIDTVFVNVKALTVDAGSDELLYCGDTISLNATSNSNSVNYLWSPDIAISDSLIYNPFVFSDTTVTYTVTAKAMNGCSSSDDIIIKKNFPVNICMVKNSGTNSVVWEKPITTYIDSFFIYRKKQEDTSYQKIGSVDYSSISIFNDITSDASIGGYSYKMSTYACGLETVKSEEHTTMFLKTTFDNDTAWNLEWTPYKGREGKKYLIFRGTSESNLELIDNVSDAVATYRDPSPPAGNVYYQVKLLLNDYCFYLPGYGYNTLSSNIANSYMDTNKYFKIKDNTIDELPTVNSIYSENFEGSNDMPIGFTLIDYDKLIPFKSFDFIDDAWVIMPDLANSKNNIALTTSYYRPKGKSDDWMILPRIEIKKNTILSWKVQTYNYLFPEMYEVRISQTGKQTKDFKSVVYVNNNESGPSKTRLVSLEENGFSDGDSVYIAFRNVSDFKYLFHIDDIELFTTDTIIDMGVLSIDVPKYIELNKSISIKGILMNFGADRVKSFDINWMVEGNDTVKTFSYNKSNIGSFAQYSFEFDQEWLSSIPGQYIHKVWVSNIDGKTDGNNENDTVTAKIFVLESFPKKNVLFEEGTGAWCGFCPDGMVKLEEIKKDDKSLIGVSIHSGDAMAFDDGNTINGNYFTGYPSGMVDRYKFDDGNIEMSDRSDWKSKASERKEMPVTIEVKGTHDYDPITRELTVNVKSQFFVDYSADLRMNCYIVEDSVSGTGNMYDQTNYFNGDTSHPMSGMGDPIIDYQHRHVLREMLGGPWGSMRSIPYYVSLGDTISYQYKTTLSEEYNDERISLVLLVQKYNPSDYTDREIINACELHLGEANNIGIEDNHLQIEMIRLHPNPAKDNACIDLKINRSQNIKIDIFDIMGKQISSNEYNNIVAKIKHVYKIDTKSLSKGIYLVRVSGDKFSVSKKLIKE